MFYSKKVRPPPPPLILPEPPWTSPGPPGRRQNVESSTSGKYGYNTDHGRYDDDEEEDDEDDEDEDNLWAEDVDGKDAPWGPYALAAREQNR